MARASMPKASIDENRYTRSREHDIYRSAVTQNLELKTEPTPAAMKFAAECHFRSGIARLDRRHVGTSPWVT